MRILFVIRCTMNCEIRIKLHPKLFRKPSQELSRTELQRKNIPWRSENIYLRSTPVDKDWHILKTFCTTNYASHVKRCEVLTRIVHAKYSSKIPRVRESGKPNVRCSRWAARVTSAKWQTIVLAWKPELFLHRSTWYGFFDFSVSHIVLRPRFHWKVNDLSSSASLNRHNLWPLPDLENAELSPYSKSQISQRKIFDNVHPLRFMTVLSSVLERASTTTRATSIQIFWWNSFEMKLNWTTSLLRSLNCPMFARITW